MEKTMCLSEIALAARWGISPKTLQRWRTKKSGPPYLKLSKRVAYLIEDVVAYEQQRKRMPQFIDRIYPEKQDAPRQNTAPEMAPKQLFTLREALARMTRHGSIEDPTPTPTTAPRQEMPLASQRGA